MHGEVAVVELQGDGILGDVGLHRPVEPSRCGGFHFYGHFDSGSLGSGERPYDGFGYVGGHAGPAAGFRYGHPAVVMIRVGCLERVRGESPGPGVQRCASRGGSRWDEIVG